MKEETVLLLIEVQQLKKISMGQKCFDCLLLRNYFITKYEQLLYRTTLIERLIKTNSQLNSAIQIKEVQQSLALVGLYMNV